MSSCLRIASPGAHLHLTRQLAFRHSIRIQPAFILRPHALVSPSIPTIRTTAAPVFSQFFSTSSSNPYATETSTTPAEAVQPLDYAAIEKKWLQRWKETRAGKAVSDGRRPLLERLRHQQGRALPLQG
ncbi:hypothetical protein BC939DRAFT_498677 [Gamsiella multidivaricata]|uniref:uncharacterized protein n=1 Tax=Gamsiella multidivaricata TaxID=101098 RepID=UPI00221FD7B6|nr:uncharacterized protein BC939DRAFT_498677 [Gamsiella multidivaricata]KAI7831707.1 hypothetical protein BC939DRAFT_498677 [Gamsiella multidivaricata]